MPDIVSDRRLRLHLVAANAFLPAPRVAEARDMDPETLLQLIEDATIQGGSGMLETRP